MHSAAYALWQVITGADRLDFHLTAAPVPMKPGRYTLEARHERTCRLCNSANAIEDEQSITSCCDAPSLMTCATPIATCSSTQERL